MGAPTITEGREALARSAVYALLARSLAWPSDERLTEVRELVAPLALEVRAPGIEDAIGAVVDGLGRPPAGLRRAHALLFPAVESPDCPSYETGYSPGDAFRLADVMADVAGFYRAHGLQPGASERERPDHIAAELEFMAFMAHKELYAIEHLGDDEVEECRRTQATFLRDHLGCWGPSFGLRMALLSDDPLYEAVGRLLSTWIEADMAAMGVAPAERLDEPVPQPGPDDGECGVPIGASEVPVAMPRGKEGGRP